jgi:hypothetical protein
LGAELGRPWPKPLAAPQPHEAKPWTTMQR